MKALLTGATGFIGSHVAHMLLQAGWGVTAIVLPNEDTWRIDDIKGNINIIYGDLRDDENISKQLKNIQSDICIHLAWYVQPGKYWQALDNLDILNASLRFTQHVAQSGCKRFIGMGTCAEYDMSYGYLSEDTNLLPASLYAASKLSYYFLLNELGKLMSMETVWLRLFYPYGPKEDNKRLIPHVICSLLKDEPVKTTKGDQIRDYIYIEDVAMAICEVAESNLIGTVNIGSGKPISVLEIVNFIGKLLNRSDLILAGEIPKPENDPPFICANNFKLKSIGWSPKYNIGGGLQQTIKWWQNNNNLWDL